MSLKAKLISSISAFVLILTIVIVGVWAASTANVSLGGTVNFQATNVYAKVSGTVTGMDSNPTLPTLTFSEGEDASEEPEIEQWNNLDLVFKTSGTPIEIEVTVENLSDERSLGVSIQNQIASIENIDISITSEGEASTSATLSPSTGSGTSTVTFLVTVSLQNPNISVTDALYDILIILTDESQMKQINVYSNDPSFGTVSGGGLYAPGSTVTLTATANDNSAAYVFGFTADSVDGPMVQCFFLEDMTTTAYFTFSLNEDSTDYYAIFISEEDYSQMFEWATGDGFSDNPTNFEAYLLLPGVDIALLMGAYRNEEGVSIEEYTIPETVMAPVSAPDDPTSVSEMKEYRVIGFFGTLNQPSTVYLFDGSSFENLKKVIIPENVTYTPSGGSLTSPTIESYEVDPNNPVFSAVNGNVLFDRLTKTVLSACKGGEIPEGTKVIGEEAFRAHEFESITIPQSVVFIDYAAFERCSNLTSITIPEGVTTIGQRAFRECSNLTSVTIEGVTSIGGDAFWDCYALAIVYNNSSLEITKGESGHGRVAYYAKEVVANGQQAQGRIEESGNVNYYINETTGEYIALVPSISRDLVTQIAIAAGAKEINQYAFYGCSSLTSITIPAGVTSIGEGAFQDCRDLTSITLPSTLTSIGSYAFYDCYALAIVYNNSSLTIDGSYSCGYLGQYAKEIVNNGEQPQGSIEESGNVNYYINETTGEYIALLPSISRDLVTQITIAAGAKEINQYAFIDCWALETVIFEENSQLTSIGDYAFDGCISLTSITIPEGVSEIGSYAFYNCSNLTSITIPEGVTSIGTSAFQGCSNLTSITIPEGVTSIENSAFRGCSNLTSITLPSTLTSIGESAFNGCRSLTSITIPEGVTSIGSSAFQSCRSLEAFYGTGNSYYTIDDNRALIVDGGETLLAYAAANPATSYSIPEGVTLIGDYAFHDCSNLTSITLPSTLTSIGWNAFQGCSSLAEISINGNISTLGRSVFWDCSNLTKLTLGSNVTTLPSNLFSGSMLTRLTEIVVEEGSSLSAALPTYGTWVKDGGSETVTSFSGAGTYTRTDI